NNCYFNDLTNHVDVTGNSNQTYVANDLLIASSPLLGTNHEPLWTSSVISPVIDRGVSTMLDPDETPSDIGAIRAGDHQYDIYQMPTGFVSDGIKWMSFPIINNITTGYNVSENFFGPIVDPDILDWVQWKELEDPIETMEYVNTQLNNGNHVVNSVQGFKVKVQWDVFDEYSIPVTGYRQAPHTVIQLEGNEVENWIGYFCEESSSVLDAFSPILTSIKSIQTQYWSVYQISPGVWLGNVGNRVLNDGDMVIVKCIQDCSFSWNNNHQVPPTSKGLTKEFTYTEKPEYIPVYISIDQNNDLGIPAEIGLFVNGVCKGAAVVDNPEVDICAYLNANEDITEENSQLVFYYPAKSSVNQRSTYSINRKSLKHNTIGTEYYVININDIESAVPVSTTSMLSQNYPNPFNPTTSIAYEIPTDGLVSLDIFNVRGELVKRLLNTNKAMGKHSVVWDGKDNQGRHCSSGIYYYRLKSNGVSHTQKMLLLK
ncbi:MAG: FlgD immunoglobulin-like domain containing protein, partial [Candidatus Cloacimonetes bacterium]|nr:FlgD immunoglobulin-like domain containing protein [Candidatus Cloacimonadota bacterium]